MDYKYEVEFLAQLIEQGDISLQSTDRLPPVLIERLSDLAVRSEELFRRVGSLLLTSPHCSTSLLEYFTELWESIKAPVDSRTFRMTLLFSYFRSAAKNPALPKDIANRLVRHFLDVYSSIFEISAEYGSSILANPSVPEDILLYCSDPEKVFTGLVYKRYANCFGSSLPLPNSYDDAVKVFKEISTLSPRHTLPLVSNVAHDMSLILGAVAANPSLPRPQTRLVYGYAIAANDSAVLESLAGNSATAPDVLAKMAMCRYLGVRLRAMRHPALPRHCLEKILNKLIKGEYKHPKDKEIAAAICGNPSATGEDLASLCQGGNCTTPPGVIQNKRV